MTNDEIEGLRRRIAEENAEAWLLNAGFRAGVETTLDMLAERRRDALLARDWSTDWDGLPEAPPFR